MIGANRLDKSFYLRSGTCKNFTHVRNNIFFRISYTIQYVLNFFSIYLTLFCTLLLTRAVSELLMLSDFTNLYFVSFISAKKDSRGRKIIFLYDLASVCRKKCRKYPKILVHCCLDVS